MSIKVIAISISLIMLSSATAQTVMSSKQSENKNSEHSAIELADSLSPLLTFHTWTPLLIPKPRPLPKYLTDTDFEQAARQLGVEVATIKAVVQIEAGPSGKGFSEEGVPIINFDLTLFRKFSKKAGIKLSQFRESNPAVFESLKPHKYGNIQKAQYARLNSAMEIDSVVALESTFWGLFQIGGFNWKKCGCTSVGNFVDLMSTSEHEQLTLFVNFILSQHLEGYLQTKNWSAFALRYNGKNYARHNYHTRLARAYIKYATMK